MGTGQATLSRKAILDFHGAPVTLEEPFGEAMMTRRLTFLAILSAAISIPAFAAPVPKHLMPKDQPVPFPTAKGTTWVYGDDGVTGGNDTRVITDSKEKDGATLVTTEWRDFNGNTFSKVVWSVTAKGVFAVSSDGVKYDPPWCVFKYPYREGQSWPTNEQLNGAELPGTRKAGPMERVEVPAGEFTAVRVDWEYKIGGRTERMTLWYAPGVGKVKSVYGDGKGRRATVLKSFTPGKK